MKKHLLCWGVGLCLTLFAVGMSSCSKEDTPQPDPTPQSVLEDAVVGKYWTEKIYFMRWVDGEVVCDDIEIFGYVQDGGLSFRPECAALQDFYVCEDGKVYRYFEDKYGLYSTYYANQYTISYNPNGQSVRIDAKADSLRYMGAVTGVDMMVKEVYDDQIVFDVPFIKEYIAIRWRIYEDAPWYIEDPIVGLRVYWTQKSPTNFKYAEPLD